MIQCIYDESDVFAHITVDIIRFGEEFRRLIDQVRGEDTADDTVLIRFVELLHTIGEQAERSGSKDPFCFSPL